ncbi:hypothetical protein [Enterococcus asini]|uniref:hypothetical protein n=1 Tax=Enterococcus asini TaxID=57732 RepID=UPI0015F59498|nr:hypothetical protein [Enterococcus asini]
MATKSFQTDFKLNQKASAKLAEALENSKRVKHTIQKPVNELKTPDSINKMMASFLGK